MSAFFIVCGVILFGYIGFTGFSAARREKSQRFKAEEFRTSSASSLDQAAAEPTPQAAHHTTQPHAIHTIEPENPASDTRYHADSSHISIRIPQAETQTASQHPEQPPIETQPQAPRSVMLWVHGQNFNGDDLAARFARFGLSFTPSDSQTGYFQRLEQRNGEIFPIFTVSQAQAPWAFTLPLSTVNTTALGFYINLPNHWGTQVTDFEAMRNVAYHFAQEMGAHLSDELGRPFDAESEHYYRQILNGAY